jgi:uncharacterized protein (TIGR03067 family)
MTVLFLTLALLSPTQEDRKALDALQGTWFAVTLQDEERQAPLETIKQFKLVIKDQKMLFSSEGISEIREMGFRLDPTQKPPAIDLAVLSGPQQGKAIPGIYELKGDELKICLPTRPNEKGQWERPKDFDCKKRSGLGLFVVRKKKD